MTSKDDRRSHELSSLDIDRRKAQADSRRDSARRPMLTNMYEEIYISSYINSIHPKFVSKVHALSNLAGEFELSPAEWAVAGLARADGQSGKALRPLREFALEMIRQGLVVDENGQPVIEIKSSVSSPAHFEYYLMKTGS